MTSQVDGKVKTTGRRRVFPGDGGEPSRAVQASYEENTEVVVINSRGFNMNESHSVGGPVDNQVLACQFVFVNVFR